jgi:hypothetical protein
LPHVLQHCQQPLRLLLPLLAGDRAPPGLWLPCRLLLLPCLLVLPLLLLLLLLLLRCLVHAAQRQHCQQQVAHQAAHIECQRARRGKLPVNQVQAARRGQEVA